MGWTGFARAFDGKWYPVAVVHGRRLRVQSVAGDVSPAVAIEIHYELDAKEACERLLEQLAWSGYRNVSMSVAPPSQLEPER